MLRLRLGLDLIGEDDGALNIAPTDIIWAGSHAIAEDAELGTVIGGALSAVDSEMDAITFTLADDADGKFAIGDDGTSIIVSGVLDYEAETSHSITIRASDGILTYDETFNITVTDVTEDVPENPLPPDGEVIVDDAASYDVLPSVTVVSEGVKAHGKKKATGASAKFLYDYLVPVANTTIVIQYDPDFSLLTDAGVGAFVGFGFKTGNAFQLIGPKGDGSTGLHKVKITGDSPSGWSQSSGHTISDGGAVANGTQAGPNWIALTFSADGTTATLRSSGDNAATWSNEYVAAASSPLSSWIGNDESGVAGYLPATSSGSFSVNFLDAYVVPAPTITSASSGNVAENATLSHALTANQTVTWSIVGGADQDDYEISGSTLRFNSNSTQDFEVPDDSNANNTYVVNVRATNEFGQTTDQIITYTVTDVAEPIITYIGNAAATGSTANWTFNTHNIGTASSDRVVVIAATSRRSSGAHEIWNATIDGVRMRRVPAVGAAAGASSTALFYLLWPTGTTATIVINCTTVGASASISALNIKGVAAGAVRLESAEVIANDVTGTASLNIVLSNVAALVGAVFGKDVGTSAFTWTGLTEQNDVQQASDARHSAAMLNASGVPSPLTVSAANASNNRGLVVGSFVPRLTETAPSVVQFKHSLTSQGGAITMDAAPTQGNLLIAHQYHLSDGIAAASGWALLSSTDGGAGDGIAVYYKIAGASETASQTPSSAVGSNNGSMMIWEIANAGLLGTTINWFDQSLGAIVGSAGTSQSVTGTPSSDNALLLASVEVNAQNPTVTAGTQDASANNGTRGIAAAHIAGTAAGTAVTATFTFTSTTYNWIGVTIHPKQT